MAPDTARHFQSRTTSDVASGIILNKSLPGSQGPYGQGRRGKILEKLRQVVPRVPNSLRWSHIRLHFWRHGPQQPTSRRAVAQVDATRSSNEVAAPALPPSCVNDPICSISNSPLPHNASSADARSSGGLQRENGDRISGPPAAELQDQSEIQTYRSSTSSAANDRNESDSPTSATVLDQFLSPTISDHMSHGALQSQPTPAGGVMTSSVRDSWSEMPLEPYHAPPGQRVVRIKPISFVNPDPRTSEQEIRPVSLMTTSEGSDDEPVQYIVSMAIHKPGVTEPEHITPRRGLLDTGSRVNVVSEKVVAELNMTPWYAKNQILTLGDGPVATIGVVVMRWHVDGRPEKTYYTQFSVLPREIECAFDFLIGSGWIRRTKALIPNREVFFLQHTE
jgi:hypothetical protein